MRHDQSSINKINSKVLDGCRDFLWRDEERAPLICREKVTELLTAEDLVVTCKGSFKQNMITHLSIKCKKVLDSCRGFFVEGWRMNTSHLSRKKSPNWLAAKDLVLLVSPHPNETWSINTLRPFRNSRLNICLWKAKCLSSTVEFWNKEKKCLKRTAKCWPHSAQHEQD